MKSQLVPPQSRVAIPPLSSVSRVRAAGLVGEGEAQRWWAGQQRGIEDGTFFSATLLARPPATGATATHPTCSVLGGRRWCTTWRENVRIGPLAGSR